MLFLCQQVSLMIVVLAWAKLLDLEIMVGA
jgi:hypothetical protein